MNIGDIISLTFESASALLAFLAAFYAIKTQLKYPELTKKGWIFVVIALILLGIHMVIDSIDTVVYDLEGNATGKILGILVSKPIYRILDWTENLLYGISIFLLGIGLLKVSLYLLRFIGGEKK